MVRTVDRPTQKLPATISPNNDNGYWESWFVTYNRLVAQLKEKQHH
ncbi:MAG: hypothetical protein SAL07_15940 [Oscillatoria sp. PMC 1051.18]|nr:hypothetical protein [Oscillatoria salina]MBZ8181693.1 hypothetical protein [Oscillatoria salina IIICB1]MEC4894942.1 hypothetical protein [Oscillatoria sp. PMC 1050.18]MEC5031390.1 hypothetical protein [Oscillatoria sp. PMC 1051.18]NET89630.1 hypothetical protein [Kamptonema sp. SIO1D9]